MRVHACEALLVGLEVVIRAVVRLYMAVLGAEHVTALACDLNNSDFLRAEPALILVCLSEKRGS